MQSCSWTEKPIVRTDYLCCTSGLWFRWRGYSKLWQFVLGLTNGHWSHFTRCLILCIHYPQLGNTGIQANQVLVIALVRCFDIEKSRLVTLYFWYVVGRHILTVFIWRRLKSPECKLKIHWRETGRVTIMHHFMRVIAQMQQMKQR